MPYSSRLLIIKYKPIPYSYLEARSFIRSKIPKRTQLLCANKMDWALHFWPLHAYASWSHCQAT